MTPYALAHVGQPKVILNLELGKLHITRASIPRDTVKHSFCANYLWQRAMPYEKYHLPKMISAWIG